MKRVVGVFVVLALFFGGGVALGAFVIDDDEPETGRRRRSPEPTTSPTAPASPSPSVPDPTPDDRPTAACSAAGLSPTPVVQEGLPEEVAAMRRAIAAAAAACDFDAIERLALGGAGGFTYSFGDDGDPGGYFRTLEASEGPDADVMATLVETLDLPYCVDRVGGRPRVFVWPSAFCADATDADWAALEGLYTDAEIRRMRSFGGFIGWRAGITGSGDWQFFVAGD